MRRSISPPKSKTSPEMIPVLITWHGFDQAGNSLTLSVDARVYRVEPRSSTIRRWKLYYWAQPQCQEVVARLYDEEYEYTWKNHYETEASPQWTQGQQIIFKLRPWRPENTGERLRKRPQPSPDGRWEPLCPPPHLSAPVDRMERGDRGPVWPA
jgi:hypothetical protein